MTSTSDRPGPGAATERFDRRALGLSLGLMAATFLTSHRAHAQAESAAPPQPAPAAPASASPALAEPAAPATAKPETGPAAPAAATSAPSLPPAAVPDAAPPAPEAKPEEKLPPIHLAAWARVGARVQGTSDPSKLNDQTMDTVYAELHASVNVTKIVSVIFNVNGDGLGAKVGVEDAIVGFDFADPFHIWVGQLLVPVDRANFGGPFFAIPWNYPGVLSVGSNTVLMLPREGPYGRNAGAAVWGDIWGGALKYLAGAFDTGEAKTPLFSGRVLFDVVGKEPGYFGNASYFGDQNVLALAAGLQYQKDGSVGLAPMMGAAAPTDNYSEFNADALAEFKLPSGGWVTADAAYYHFAGNYEQIHDSFYALAAIATPQIGIGNIQPMVRYQGGYGDNGTKVSAIDASIAYLMKGPALRVTLGYQHTDLGNGVVGNALQLGAQAIVF
jgi:hypothetical protein